MRPEGELEAVAGGVEDWGVCILAGIGWGTMCAVIGITLCVVAGISE